MDFKDTKIKQRMMRAGTAKKFSSKRNGKTIECPKNPVIRNIIKDLFAKKNK